jgi:hypothetical protein
VYCVADSETYIVIKYNSENKISGSTEKKQEQFNPKVNTLKEINQGKEHVEI